MANLIYQKSGSITSWKTSGGTYTITPTSVANAAGRLGGQGDIGPYTTARSRLFRWYAETKVQATTPVVGKTVDIYLAWWNNDDATNEADADVGTADAAFATEAHLRQLHYIGSIILRSTSTTDVHTGSGTCLIPTRYGSPVWWNGTGASLSATAGDHFMYLCPIPDEIQ